VSTISTHVLDSAAGRPAAGMLVTIEKAVDKTVDKAAPDSAPGRAWLRLGSALTDADGRLNSWSDTTIDAGSYRLVFDTGGWFAGLDRECFYPEVVITFTVDDDGSHYHVPLLLAAYAYSTYRGS
jgi:5-hydroxyisourate hydrolase